MARRGFLRRLSVGLCCPRKGEALPGFWAVLLSRAVVGDPAECSAVLPSCRQQRCCLQDSRFLGHSVSHCFEAVLTRPMPLRAYASSGDITAPEARLATGLPGSALAGRVSHPLDDFSEFHELPHVFIPFRPALPGRTVSEGGSVFVGGPREAESVSEGVAGRARSRTRDPHTPGAHAHRTRSRHRSRARWPAAATAWPAPGYRARPHRG
jgi:hypothetical protein